MTVVTAIETITNVKMDFVKSRLLDEELKLNSKEETIENEMVFKASTSKGCFTCGSMLHIKAYCPKRNTQAFRGAQRGGFRQKFRGNNKNYVKAKLC